jgi:AbrB family looped-hinge helix DNA binding protein
MRITTKGRVTIPAAIRRRAGLLPNTEVRIAFDGRAVVIEPVREAGSERERPSGARIVAHLRAHGGDVAMTTDEIMSLMRGEPPSDPSQR